MQIINQQIFEADIYSCNINKRGMLTYDNIMFVLGHFLKMKNCSRCEINHFNKSYRD